jgi:hypothetical protein
MIKTDLYFLLIVLLFSSCSLTENDSTNVFFLDVEKPILTTNYDKEGFSTHNIKHIWATADNQLIGVFPLGSKIPIPFNNRIAPLQLTFGINDSGDNDSSIEYPFFQPYFQDVDPKKSAEVLIKPSTAYVPNAKFDFNEDFEKTAHIFTKDLDGDNDTRVSFSSSDKVGGAQSGVIELDGDNKIVEFTTANYFDVSNYEKGPLYVEFDYKSQEDLFIGYDIITKSNLITEYKIGLKRSDIWKRMYISFGEELSKPEIEKYRIAFKSIYTGSGGLKSRIFIDNLKLIHF